MTAELGRSATPRPCTRPARRARRVVEESRESSPPRSARGRARSCSPRRHRGRQPGGQGAVLGRAAPRTRADARSSSSPVEHHAVLDPLRWLGRARGRRGRAGCRVDRLGRVDLDDAARRARRRRRTRSPLVTVMWANNEVGTVQPVARARRARARARRAVAHRRRAGGRAVAVDFAASGARRDDPDRAQDRRPARRRRAAGAPRRRPDPAAARRRAGARRALRAPSTPRRSPASPRPPRSSAEDRGARARPAGRRCATSWSPRCWPPCPTPCSTATRPGRPPARQRALLLPRLRGRRAAAAARRPRHRVLHRLGLLAPGCRSPRHVLLAMGADEDTARGVLRFSLGHTSTRADVDAVVAAIGPVVERARRAAGSGRPSRRDGDVKVLAALSGGVDSAVAAARAVDAGHDVTARAPRAVANPQSFRDRRARLLHPRGRPRRPAGGRRHRHPVLRLGPRRAVRARTSSTTSSPSTPPAARPTRACAATRGSSSPPCSTAAARSASTRSAPATTRGSSTGRAGRELHRAVDDGKDQSYVLGVLDRRPAGRRDVPARATPASPRYAPRPPRAAWPSPTSRTATTSASSPTATPPASCAQRLGASAGRRSSTPDGAVLGAHEGAFAFTVGQRRGLRHRAAGRRRAAALRPRHLPGRPAP